MATTTVQQSKARTYTICSLVIFVSFLLPGILVSISGWLVLIAIAGGVAGIFWLKRNPDYHVLGVHGASFRKALVAATVIVALGGIVLASDAESEKTLTEAKALVASKDVNSATFNTRLAQASDNVLEQLKTLAPEIYSAEMARRSALKSKENASEIAELVARIKALPQSDVDGQLIAYQELAQLNPSNTAYTASIADLEKKKLTVDGYRERPETALAVADFNGSKEGFGSILEISITIKNSAPFNIKDPVVKCEHSGASGTVMDSNERRIYEVIPANGSKRIKKFNMGFINSQAERTICEVVAAVVE